MHSLRTITQMKQAHKVNSVSGSEAEVQAVMMEVDLAVLRCPSKQLRGMV